MSNVSIMLWERTKPFTQERQTPLGKFTKIETGWEGFVEADGITIQVLLEDVAGQPHPAFLQRLPDILKNLSLLEQTARQSVERITAQHLLSVVSDSESVEDVTLGFSWEQEAWGETVFVDFRNEEIQSWCVVD